MNKTPLYVPPVAINAEDPVFHGDLFNRENLAKRLTDCIDRLPSGGVIAIDAPWGEGKSWFGQHWHNKLKADGYRTAFINAFERDYVEEPFVMLVSELMASLDVSEKSKLKKSGIAVAKAIAPLALKSAINAVAQLATGTTNFSEKVDEQFEKAGDAIAAGAEKLLSKQIEEYEKSKVAVAGFRKTLGDLASAQEKPIVIFVDELDRCRPEFAVKLIERVKHFFEIPKIIFVLLLNRDQLGKSIKGIYGQDVDADRYLGKFLHLSVGLPLSTSFNHQNINNQIFYETTLARYGLGSDRVSELWISEMRKISQIVPLSLRDIERCVAIVSLIKESAKEPYWFLAWPIVLKITHNDLYSRVLTGDKFAHSKAVVLLKQHDLDDTVGSDDIGVNFYYELHSAAEQNTSLTGNSSSSALIRELRLGYSGDPSLLLSYLFNQVNINVR